MSDHSHLQRRPRRLVAEHARRRGGGAIVVAVRVRAGREAELVGTLLAGAGGQEVRLEGGEGQGQRAAAGIHASRSAHIEECTPASA